MASNKRMVDENDDVDDCYTNEGNRSTKKLRRQIGVANGVESMLAELEEGEINENFPNNENVIHDDEEVTLNLTDELVDGLGKEDAKSVFFDPFFFHTLIRICMTSLMAGCLNIHFPLLQFYDRAETIELPFRNFQLLKKHCEKRDLKYVIADDSNDKIIVPKRYKTRELYILFRKTLLNEADFFQDLYCMNVYFHDFKSRNYPSRNINEILLMLMPYFISSKFYILQQSKYNTLREQLEMITEDVTYSKYITNKAQFKAALQTLQLRNETKVQDLSNLQCSSVKERDSYVTDIADLLIELVKEEFKNKKHSLRNLADMLVNGRLFTYMFRANSNNGDLNELIIKIGAKLGQHTLLLAPHFHVLPYSLKVSKVTSNFQQLVKFNWPWEIKRVRNLQPITKEIENRYFGQSGIVYFKPNALGFVNELLSIFSSFRTVVKHILIPDSVEVRALKDYLYPTHKSQPWGTDWSNYLLSGFNLVLWVQTDNIGRLREAILRYREKCNLLWTRNPAHSSDSAENGRLEYYNMKKLFCNSKNFYTF